MYRDKQVLNTFAKLAANEFLGQHHTPLNDTLKKIAADEGLTPHQVEYVAGEVNREVWARLFSMDKTASYDFPLADGRQVVEALQIKPQESKLNEADLDYLSPPKSTKTASFDFLGAMGFVPGFDKQASEDARRELKRTLTARMEKMATVRDEIYGRILEAQTKTENLELEFVKEARARVLEYPFEERGQALDKIAEFLNSCDGPIEYKRSLMQKLSHVCKRQGLIKEADQKAPEEYISDKLPARIVNGRHALYITVKTLFESLDDTRELRNRYEIVDSSLPMLKEKVREL